MMNLNFLLLLSHFTNPNRQILGYLVIENLDDFRYSFFGRLLSYPCRAVDKNEYSSAEAFKIYATHNRPSK